METYKFENPKYYIIDGDKNRKGIQTICDDRHISFICDENNKYYKDIMKQVKAGTLTIKDAD